MAHKKAGGSSRNGRDTAGRRLGVKKFGGEAVIAGNIIIRQRGTKWHPGTGVGIGVDHTIFATVDGTVSFKTRANATILRVGTPGMKPQNNPVGHKIPAGDQLPGKATHTAKQSSKGSRNPVPLFALRAVKMRLYLSSERLGERRRSAARHARRDAGRVAVIANGYDGAPPWPARSIAPRSTTRSPSSARSASSRTSSICAPISATPRACASASPTSTSSG